MIRKFETKTAMFAPKYALLGTCWSCWLIWCPFDWVVGGCGAQAVSRKTPIYLCIHEVWYLLMIQKSSVVPQSLMVLFMKFMCILVVYELVPPFSPPGLIWDPEAPFSDASIGKRGALETIFIVAKLWQTLLKVLRTQRFLASTESIRICRSFIWQGNVSINFCHGVWQPSLHNTTSPHVKF